MSSPIHTIPSLQGTLAKPAKPRLEPNLAKEPFRPSSSNAGLRYSASLIDKGTENNNRQCLTAHIENSLAGDLRNFVPCGKNTNG